MPAPADDLVNRGMIIQRPVAEDGAGAGRTFIVTGTYRSGTSLVAALLRAVGIFMGTEINDIVHEDEAIARVLETQDYDALRRLVLDRNAAYGTWGFKEPMLCRWLSPADMRLFQGARVILTCRDPIAVSVRTTLSEYRAPMLALRDASSDLAAIIAFASALPCPAFLVSYEKLLAFPADFVDALIRFCGLPQSSGLRDRLMSMIESSRPDYIAGSRRRYEGIIEGVRDGRLYGWCRLTGIADPVALELLADDRVVCAFTAAAFRQDLLDAGYGDGRHGFFLDLAGLPLGPDSVVRIRVAGQGIELENSGRTLAGFS